MLFRCFLFVFMGVYCIVSFADTIVLLKQPTKSRDYYSFKESSKIASIFENPLQPSEILYSPNASQSSKVFQGKPISLNFQNISKRAVLQLIAEFTGIDIVVSEKIQGNMTLRLNNLPWDHALDIILKTQGLEKRYAGPVMLIDTKENLNKIQVSQLKNHQLMHKLQPLSSDLLEINYAKATEIAALVKNRQNSLLSQRGKISVDARTNTLWIQDTRSKIKEVRKLIKQLDLPEKQVLIEARIVEVNKDFTQDIGIKWGISEASELSKGKEGTKELAQDGIASGLPIIKRLNLDLIPTVTNLATPTTLGIALAKLGRGILLDLELSALESEGKAELLASPRVITTNQQLAIIESGEEIPYQEASSSGATSVSFKKAVLSLQVIPQITANNNIVMNLQINQDTPSLEKFNGVPAIYTKQIRTNVLVNNCETIVLGGIYKQDKNQSINRVPFFGELPLLGTLFRNRQISLKNEELLIFITPKIISNLTSHEGNSMNNTRKHSWRRSEIY